MTTLVKRHGLAGAIAVVLVLAFAGCGPKRTPALAAPGAIGAVPSPSPEETIPSEEPGPDVQAIGGGDMAIGSDLLDTSSLTASGEGGPLDDIHFAYDSAELSDAARATLDHHAIWLQSHREARVTIEGHCDARGTVEYNLALGEQRARAARDYLVGLGVAAERLRAVSFGKERPLDPSPTEAAYAKNRRAHFVVTR
jgi:peptidoglycan-associated lipoprotein